MSNASRRDIESEIRKLILSLHNELPDNIKHYWVTAEEILQRLIHGGVSYTLKLSLVQEALKRNNNNDLFLVRHEYGGINYFRPTSVHLNDGENPALPVTQRFKGKSTDRPVRLHINPPHNYFVGEGAPSNDRLLSINRALHALESKWYTSNPYV